MEQSSQTPQQNSFKDVALRVVAIIGLVAIIILGAWGIIQIAFNLPNLIGGIGSSTQTLVTSTKGTESIAVSLPQSVTSGTPFMATWKHLNAGSGDYSYTLSYSCTPGLTMKAPTPDGTFENVPCATPFNYTDATTNMQLVPSVTGSQQVTTNISVSAVALSDGAVTATGSGVLAVLPSSTQTTPPPAVTTKPAAPAPTVKKVTAPAHYSNPNGTPDLAVQILSTIPQGNGLVTMQFAISNVGTKATPYGWTFAVNLPVGYAYTYYSQPQQILYPGDKIIYKLTFSTTNTNNQNNNCTVQSNGYTYQNCYSYTNTTYPSAQSATVTVDPGNLIYEASKANNSATATW